MTLEVLLRRACDGNEAARRALFEMFQAEIMAYCFLSCGRRRDLALDLTQDVFLRAFRNLHQIKDPQKVRSWLYRIASNVCHSHFSATARERRALEAFHLEHEVMLEGEDHRGMQVRAQIVRQALDGVEHEKMRQIALLKYTDPEHTTREIAACLSMPHGTVTVMLSRFRKRFRRVLIQTFVDAGEDV